MRVFRCTATPGRKTESRPRQFGTGFRLFVTDPAATDLNLSFRDWRISHSLRERKVVMNPLNSKGSPRSQSGANSSPPEKPAEGTTPNTASNPTTAGSDTRFISAFLKSRNMTRLMQGYPVRSMEEFYQAGKALLDIPANENVEFIVNGDVASRLSLDEFARIAPTLAVIQVVSRPPKKV
jgi:hypothetical protein